MQKRGKLVASLLVVLVVISALAISIDYSIDYATRGPFHNHWEKSIKGQPDYGIIWNGTAYLVSSVSNNSFFITDYYIHRLDANNGGNVWTSKAITIAGMQNFLVLPLHDNGALGGPQLFIWNGTMYVAFMNSSYYKDLFNTYGPSFNLTIFAVNASNGAFGEAETFHPNVWNSSANVCDFALLFQDGKLYLSYEILTYSLSNLSSFTTEFYVTSLEFINHDFNLGPTASINVSNPSQIGTGMENIYSDQSNILYSLNYQSAVVAQNKSTSVLQKFSNLSDPIGLYRDEIYTAYNTNDTLHIGSLEINSGIQKDLFNASIPNLNSSDFIANVLPNGTIYLTSQTGGIGSAVIQNNIEFIGYSSAGEVIWNMSLEPDPFGQWTLTEYIGNGRILLTTNPGWINAGSYSYNSQIIVVNSTSGNIVLNEDYKYQLGLSGGKVSTPFLSPPQFNGVLAASQNLIIYDIGSKIACATL